MENKSYSIQNVVKYVKWCHDGQDCVVIYGLFVHPKMRNKKIGTMLLLTAIDEIKRKFKGLPIKIEAIPYGCGKKLNKTELEEFYLKLGLEVIEIKRD
jgi:GNAT superfamily N-acetyltransferase